MFPMTVSAASIGISLVIIMDCVMTFFGSAANDACFNAWLTDVTDDTNRGAAEGINSMMPLVAILVVFGGFMGFDLNKAESWTLIYQIIGIVVFILGILAIFLVKDVPVDTSANQNYFGKFIRKNINIFILSETVIK
jgi:MFS family permease